jgi:hypothetical protein
MAEGELGKGPPEEDRNYNAIRAILEQHEAVRTKLMLLETAAKFQECEAIRAFVKRVEKRAKVVASTQGLGFLNPAGYFYEQLYKELAAMEKEAE